MRRLGRVLAARDRGRRRWICSLVLTFCMSASKYEENVVGRGMLEMRSREARFEDDSRAALTGCGTSEVDIRSAPLGELTGIDVEPQ